MSNGTSIEGTHVPGYRSATWNPISGCTRVSEGCRNCYAERMAARFSNPGQWGHGFAHAGGRWTGRVELIESKLDIPLRAGKPTCYFVNSTSDLFHEKVSLAALDHIFAVMALCPQHLFIILTKRAGRMLEYMTAEVRGPWAGRAHVVKEGGKVMPMTDVHFRMNSALGDIFPKAPSEALNRAAAWQDEHFPDGDGFLREWPLPNVWFGVSAEDQPTADERIPDLLATPAAKRIVSVEPMLGPVDLSPWLNRLDWVICGGESGPGARPMHPDWARSLRDQCVGAGVPFFFKQITENGRKIPFAAWPDDLRIREFPHA